MSGTLAGRARGVAAAWNRFWFAEVDGRPLGLARIGVAVAGLVLWTGILPLLPTYYTDGGQLPLEAARRWGTEAVSRFLMVDALGSLPAVGALFALWGAVLVALLVGWRTRAAAVAAWPLTAWFLLRNPTFLNGGDEVLRLATLYLAVGFLFIDPRDRAYSLDRRRALSAEGADPRRVPPRVPAWPLRILQIQVAIVYLVSGFWKVVGPPWWDGSAVYYALGNSAFSRFGLPPWAWLQPVFLVAGVSVAWWEFLFPGLVGWSRTRRAALLYGVVLHGSILLLMNIGIFSVVMLGLYPVYLRGEEVERLLEPVRRLSSLPRRRSSAATASRASA